MLYLEYSNLINEKLKGNQYSAAAFSQAQYDFVMICITLY